MTRKERDELYRKIYYRFILPIQVDLNMLYEVCNNYCDRRIKVENKILSLKQFIENLEVEDVKTSYHKNTEESEHYHV